MVPEHRNKQSDSLVWFRKRKLSTLSPFTALCAGHSRSNCFYPPSARYVTASMLRPRPLCRFFLTRLAHYTRANPPQTPTPLPLPDHRPPLMPLCANDKPRLVTLRSPGGLYLYVSPAGRKPPHVRLDRRRWTLFYVHNSPSRATSIRIAERGADASTSLWLSADQSGALGVAPSPGPSEVFDVAWDDDRLGLRGWTGDWVAAEGGRVSCSATQFDPATCRFEVRLHPAPAKCCGAAVCCSFSLGSYDAFQCGLRVHVFRRRPEREVGLKSVHLLSRWDGLCECVDVAFNAQDVQRGTQRGQD